MPSDRRERRVSRVGWSWQCLAAWLMLLRQADASQGGLQSKHERSQPRRLTSRETKHEA